MISPHTHTHTHTHKHKHTHTHRVFNAFNDSGMDFGVNLTAGSGDVNACSQDAFDSSELSFMGVSNRSNVTVGKYVCGIDSAQCSRGEITYTIGWVLIAKCRLRGGHMYISAL